MTYELGLKRSEEDVKKKKPLALKASPSTKKATEESESSTSEDDSVCYNYRKPGHVKSECPESLKKAQPRWTKNKQKAMVGTWSEEEDDEDEESSESEESQTKICLMTRGEEGDEEEKLPL
ncbi:hypothetical protein Taro_042369 [Colocasia esculenta]|uniref:CCHC-type domain-containing protein n=1 Tax=Colocasia esculenta TaxID=4460 RepID=A0A843WSM4_COLES|nr:hypothetical protein [Colocasia esculenta]